MAKKQGYYDREDESDAMRLGKGHSGKKTRDESYGDWGKRSTDWKSNHGGHSSVHKVLHHSRKNTGRFSNESAELKYMPVVDREKDAMKAGDESPFRKEGEPKREVRKTTDKKTGKTTKTVFGKGDEYAKKVVRKSDKADKSKKLKAKTKMSGKTGETTKHTFKEKQTGLGETGTATLKTKTVEKKGKGVKKREVAKDKTTGQKVIRKTKDGATKTKMKSKGQKTQRTKTPAPVGT